MSGRTLGASIAGKGRVTVGDTVVLDDPARELPRGDWVFGFGCAEQFATVDLVAGEPVPIRVATSGVRGMAALTLGVRAPRDVELIDEAAAAAAAADVAVVVGGTSDEWETEGVDRTTLALPGDQDELSAAPPRSAPDRRVLNCGDRCSPRGPIRSTPCWRRSPRRSDRRSPRLPATASRRSAADHLAGPPRGLPGVAALRAGRRGADLRGGAHDRLPGPRRVRGRAPVRFRTRRLLRIVTVERRVSRPGGDRRRRGRRGGRHRRVDRRPARADVVQVYREEAAAGRPPQALVGSATPGTAPGRTAPVTVRIPAAALRRWDDELDSWRTDVGTHRLLVAASATDVRHTVELTVSG